MFIRSKPIPFSYKLWCLCGADGYPYHMAIYTGRAENSTDHLGSRVVNEKVDVILQNSDPFNIASNSILQVTSLHIYQQKP